MNYDFNVIVVGGGHAGCEAALAAARMGFNTALITMDPDTIAQMSCNPAIGGLAKGQLVREIDALGGEMAKVTDATGIQFRMLNTKKGPAVRSPRAQADKHLYKEEMRRRLETQENLFILRDTAESLLMDRNKVAGVGGGSGVEYRAEAVIITTGTFLRGVMHTGKTITVGGRAGEPSAENLSGSLRAVGLELGRLKTGTPPRLNAGGIPFEELASQHGDERPQPFSFSTAEIRRPQVPCYITYTNPKTHKIIKDNLDRSPLYTGQIKAIGPRYCPSIEDKVVRFADKDAHQVFLEPEGLDSQEIYCNGISTSLPCDVQEELAHSIRGLERAEIVRYGYAVEYDFVPPTQIKANLETKCVEGLFLAGQINGTSGYEEAAAQGIMAGINAVLKLQGRPPFILDRSEAYIGVLIDDLVTKGTLEPYRMFTSRAEYRLILRQDNADRRLMKYGHQFGLISRPQWNRLEEKESLINWTRAYLKENLCRGESLEKILRRPEIDFNHVMELDLGHKLKKKELPQDVKEQVEIEVKYEGYIQRQLAQVEKFKKMETLGLPSWLNYSKIPELTNEARQKLNQIRPTSLGQASRISGISPADISVLLIYLKGKADRSRSPA
ncbi:MAG: tRNA uridine-5-carboxymethylaminomethyl(34) synthesis enzyme MnmG [Planctomycetes bacterium RIFCSPHIGHO2_02_FULL_50_42]|nr:MAG: tRNA uridine-5-carboxymethylaminomethyl(34) synthesis enzyme MnmG [Planctomycetes bacterium RIFCSPHIGHO2_02_FULL_50_42]OHB91653.1 MAG: tRNA uridine-5-carboxymethylaminomethyl(34) synthesis enzyme MnmG [Planctomycetes bacterium RIFCSPHIGHO2_12_FULL_51_37]OHC03130.1 MAG: tRNA uridine-5-carboxymethylaminomethyl(34) synthesis enzyme MnmG [Planctomycetes bacterium RIFCSPLOWO2_12_FULL_50_35]